MTLLLVIVILSAILSIGIGVFSSIYGQLIISGQAENSLRALYAADQGIEKMLYRSRVLENCGSDGSDCSVPLTLAQSGGCYATQVTKTDIEPDGFLDIVIKVTGSYRCDQTLARSVKRAFEITFPSP
ncbi:MAG: hypothetical protein G01um101433_129 [Parcubacteria group bacterium Gr01-1014_33]|nr:MAG: hypothetical protein G01um101433_129 [Parcubacteria group bacterium Gr01-1014_33]